MANLIVRNLDEKTVQALKEQAVRHGCSAEAEHRRILESLLVKTRRKSLAKVLLEMPNVGRDEDFVRKEDNGAPHVFD